MGWVGLGRIGLGWVVLDVNWTGFDNNKLWTACEPTYSKEAHHTVIYRSTYNFVLYISFYNKYTQTTLNIVI